MVNSYNSDSLKKEMVETLKKCLGVVTSAVDKVGISRSTHYEWLKDDPEYKKAVDEIAERAIDFVETKMFEQVNNGDSGLIKYYLSTKGKQRGYVERTEQAQVTKDGEDVDLTNITITFE